MSIRWGEGFSRLKMITQNDRWSPPAVTGESGVDLSGHWADQAQGEDRGAAGAVAGGLPVVAEALAHARTHGVTYRPGGEQYRAGEYDDIGGRRAGAGDPIE